jgi:VanZ family protein
VTRTDVSSRPRLPPPILWGARLATWGLIAAVGVFSLLPGEMMPEIGRGLGEHLLAYLAFAGAAALGYGRRFGYGVLFVAAVGFAGLFEIAQLLLPERTFSWMDFLAGGAGAALGVTLAQIVRAVAGRPQGADA